MDITISERAPVEHYMAVLRRTLLYAYGTEKPGGTAAGLAEAQLYHAALGRELAALRERLAHHSDSAISTRSTSRRRAA